MSYRASRLPATRSKSPPADISLDQHISASIDFTAATYISKEINCPKLKEGYYMVIHEVEIEYTDPENRDADTESFEWQLTDEEETAMLQLDDEDLIMKGKAVVVSVGTAATALDVHLPLSKCPKLPILYPHDKIYLGVLGTPVTNGPTGIAYIRIHFAVKQISDFMVNMVMKKK